MLWDAVGGYARGKYRQLVDLGLRSPHRESPGTAVPQCLTPQPASPPAMDCSVASPTKAFNAGSNPTRFPTTPPARTKCLTATRTGLTPAGDDELPIRP